MSDEQPETQTGPLAAGRFLGVEPYPITEATEPVADEQEAEEDE